MQFLYDLLRKRHRINNKKLIDAFRQPELAAQPIESSTLWIHCECCPESPVWNSKIISTDKIILLKSEGTFIPRSNPYFKVIIDRAIKEEKASQIILSAHQNCKCIQSVLGHKRHLTEAVPNWERQLIQMKEDYAEGLGAISRKEQQKILMNFNLKKQTEKLFNYPAVLKNRLATRFVIFGLPDAHQLVTVHEPAYQNN